MHWMFGFHVSPLFRPNPTRDQLFTRCFRSRHRRLAATQTFLSGVPCFIHRNPRVYTGPFGCLCYSPVRRNSPAVTRRNDSLRSGRIDIGWTRGSSWAKAKSHAREMRAVLVRRDALHALGPLALQGASSRSREIGFRKADVRDRRQRVADSTDGCNILRAATAG